MTTAESALSIAETVLLLADAASRDHSFGPYTAVSLSDEEDSISGLQGTFASIQPPNDEATQLRDRLGQLLSREVDIVSEVRIAARQGQLRELEEEASDLEGISEELRAFITENQQ